MAEVTTKLTNASVDDFLHPIKDEQVLHASTLKKIVKASVQHMLKTKRVAH